MKHKAFLIGTILLQFLLVFRNPSGHSAETLLAARAILDGLIPYRDFFLHYGFVLPYLFAFLHVTHYPAGIALFLSFLFIAAWGTYKLSRRHNDENKSMIAAGLVMLVYNAMGGDTMCVETFVMALGVWGMYFFEEGQFSEAALLFFLACMTKQTAIWFPVAAILQRPPLSFWLVLGGLSLSVLSWFYLNSAIGPFFQQYGYWGLTMGFWYAKPTLWYGVKQALWYCPWFWMLCLMGRLAMSRYQLTVMGLFFLQFLIHHLAFYATCCLPIVCLWATEGMFDL